MKNSLIILSLIFSSKLFSQRLVEAELRHIQPDQLCYSFTMKGYKVIDPSDSISFDIPMCIDLPNHSNKFRYYCVNDYYCFSRFDMTSDPLFSDVNTPFFRFSARWDHIRHEINSHNSTVFQFGTIGSIRSNWDYRINQIISTQLKNSLSIDLGTIVVPSTGLNSEMKVGGVSTKWPKLLNRGDKILIKSRVDDQFNIPKPQFSAIAYDINNNEYHLDFNLVPTHYIF